MQVAVVQTFSYYVVFYYLTLQLFDLSILVLLLNFFCFYKQYYHEHSWFICMSVSLGYVPQSAIVEVEDESVNFEPF